MADEKHIIVSYDISDPHRLAQIGKKMKDYGHRVLMSVFECDLDQKTFLEMRERIEKIMHLETDSVRYYYQCKKCKNKGIVIGKKSKTQKNKDVVIV